MSTNVSRQIKGNKKKTYQTGTIDITVYWITVPTLEYRKADLLYHTTKIVYLSFKVVWDTSPCWKFVKVESILIIM